MFTGIVREQGRIVARRQTEAGAVLEIESRSVGAELRPGDSVSVDGVCLTVTALSDTAFTVEASPETLRRSNLGGCEEGRPVNLEPAARLGDLLGGHLVQGHVDAVGQVRSITPDGNSWIFRIFAPADVLRYCAVKGSIAVNGVSLTLSRLDTETFEVTVIPHTRQVTNFSSLRVGDCVNLEVDVISKYVEAHVRRILTATTILCLTLAAALASGSLPLGPKSVLIYQNTSGHRESQFVLRLARFQPDIFMEWETVSHQGTVHLHRRAVQDGLKFSLTQLFEVGVDLESRDVMTVWLSQRMYQQLMEEGTIRISLNNLPARLTLEGEGVQTVSLDRQAVEVPVIRVRDERNGNWSFLKDPENPILMEYVSPYYRQQLTSISTSKGDLRWIRRLPPIK